MVRIERLGKAMSVSLLVNAFDANGRAPYMAWINAGKLRYANQKEFPAIFAQSAGL